ncbi:low voltage-gated calcium channel [Aureococcus anophagefferens]|uniref:Low voltage-gated calcium channel n=1 Tax=Aureococcus anophagefferens TaxID=44056 RepID=A0ABR1FQG1_AURAN
MDAHLATTLRTAETLLLSPPVQVVPDAVLRDSWRVASQLDARAPADVLAGLDPATARGSVEGCLFQLKLFRIFLGRLCEPSDEPAAARLAEPASGGESSSESESSASEDEPDAPLDAGDALDASISSDDSDDETAGAARPAAPPVNLAPTQGGAAAHRRSTLEAVAAATGGPEGAVFVERFARFGGLAALLDTLQHAAPDEASQVAARFPKSPAARNAALARTQLQAAFDRADGDARRDGAAAPEDPRGCVVT